MMTLGDVSELCDRYVPLVSRHASSPHKKRFLWWPAHELGHLMVAAPREIGKVQVRPGRVGS